MVPYIYITNCLINWLHDVSPIIPSFGGFTQKKYPLKWGVVSSSVQNGKGLRYWQAKHSCSSQQFIDMTDWFPFQGTTTTYLDQIVSGKKYLVVPITVCCRGGTFWDPCWDNMGKGRLEKCCKQFSLLISNLLFLTSLRHAPSYQKPFKETTKPLHLTVFFWIRCWTQEEEIIKRHSFNSGSAKKQDKSWTKDEYNCHSLQTEIVFRKTHTICFLSRKICCSQYSFRFWNKRTLTFFPFQTICDCQTCRLRATYNLVELWKKTWRQKGSKYFFPSIYFCQIVRLGTKWS